MPWDGIVYSRPGARQRPVVTGRPHRDRKKAKRRRSGH